MTSKATSNTSRTSIPNKQEETFKIPDKIEVNLDLFEEHEEKKEKKKNQSSDNVNSTINDIIQKCNQVEEENKYMKDGFIYSRSNDLHKFQTQFNRIHRQLYGPSDEELYAFMKANNPKLKLKVDEDLVRIDDNQNEQYFKISEHKLLMENEKDRADYKVSYDYSRYLKKRAAQLHERIRRKRVLRTLDHNHSQSKQE